jgi:hypothetical protein
MSAVLVSLLSFTHAGVRDLDAYFDLAEHFALRATLLIFLLLALYRIIEREWRKR